jgi:hypothetical protein
MTREEALARMPQSRWYGEEGQRGWLIDSLAALGLLNIEQPRSTDERLAETLSATFSFTTTSKEMALFREHLAKNGLKIVATKS